MLSELDKQKLHAKVIREKSRSENHTRSWKEKTKNVAQDYLLPEPQEDRIKVRKVLNALNLRIATFLSDTMQVTNIPMNWALGERVASNCDKVFESLFDTMDVRGKYQETIIDDAMQWVWVLAVDGWNDHSLEPILSYIDSRLCYPDPKNWRDNKMSFFGTKVRKNYYELEADEAYDQEAIKLCKAFEDEDQKNIDRANNAVKGFNEATDSNEDQTDLYNHLTIFKAEDDEKPCLYLATYGNDCSILVRLVKMRALTAAEEADPSKIDFGVKLFRAKPIKWSFAGVSLVDDEGQYQAIETLLANLQIDQAIEAGAGWRTFLSTDLWVDVDDVANNTGSGDVIPFTPQNWVDARNGIYQEPSRPQNPIISNTIGYIDQLAQQADPSASALAQGQGLTGTQTKAEIQTLQQNVNHIFSYMASNYMDSLKDMWTSIYRSFAANMSPQRTKEIVVIKENGDIRSYGFKKAEFISKGNVYIKVKSKAQEDIKNKQDFAVMLSLDGAMTSLFQPWSTELAIWKRTMLNKSGIRGLDGEDYLPRTPDERKAYSHLGMLNKDIEIKSKPKPWEDHNVFINIYLKNWVPTKARDKAIKVRERILAQEIKEVAPAQDKAAEWVSRGIGASMLASDSAQQVVSTSDITA